MTHLRRGKVCYRTAAATINEHSSYSAVAHAALLGRVHWWAPRETMVSLRYANKSAACFGHNLVSSLWDWIFITMPRKRELKLRPVPSGNAILPTQQDGIFRGQLPLSSPFIQSSKTSNTNCAVRSQDDGYSRGWGSEWFWEFDRGS